MDPLSASGGVVLRLLWQTYLPAPWSGGRQRGGHLLPLRSHGLRRSAGHARRQRWPRAATARARQQKGSSSPPKKKMPRAAALKALGLPASASDEEIKLAYKAMVKKWHPDKHATADKATAQARFLEVQAAWDALKP